VGLVAAIPAGADPYVYPTKGQTPQQQEKDQFDCYQWAKGQTGFDPMQQPTATGAPPPQQQTTTSPVRGAARGAATGAVVGAIAGDAGKGAAAGAAGGAMIGGMRRRDQRRQQAYAQESWQDQQRAQYQARRNEYDRAWGACLEGKGYTVR
jgi:hypothetical protein